MRSLESAHLRTIALFLLASAIATVAQQPASPQPPALDSAPPTLKIASQLTRVDVTATDPKGKPVSGLKQAEFTVREDGRIQPIKVFEESGMQRPSLQPALPKLPPNVYTNAQPTPPSTGAVNVMMLDVVSTGEAVKLQMAPENLAYERDQAIKYVQAMPPGTGVILLELADKLRVLQSLTSDREVLLAVLRSIQYKPVARVSLASEGLKLSPQGIIPPSERTVSDDGIDPFMRDRDLPRLSQLDTCAPANAQSQMVVDALENAATYLGGIKGRKNLIWFTPGIPWLTNFPDFDEVRCLRDYTRPLQRDYGLLTAAQVSLYPVNPRGLESCSGGIGIPGRRCMRYAPEDHVSMEDMAEATGGKAYYNRNDLNAAIGEAIDIGGDFYSLFYVPPHVKYDGQYHRIDVKLDRSGIDLQYRKGYTSIDLAKQPLPAGKTTTPTDGALYAAMAHGAAPATQVLFTVGVTPSTSPAKPGDPVAGQLNPNLKLKARPLARYNFNYRVLPGDITLTESANGGHTGSVEFTVVAYNGTGDLLNVVRETASFSITQEKLAAFLKRPLPLQLQLDLPPGDLFVRAGVRDIASGKTGTVEVPVTVAR